MPKYHHYIAENEHHEIYEILIEHSEVLEEDPHCFEPEGDNGVDAVADRFPLDFVGHVEHRGTFDLMLENGEERLPGMFTNQT